MTTLYIRIENSNWTKDPGTEASGQLSKSTDGTKFTCLEDHETFYDFHKQSPDEMGEDYIIVCTATPHPNTRAVLVVHDTIHEPDQSPIVGKLLPDGKEHPEASRYALADVLNAQLGKEHEHNDAKQTIITRIGLIERNQNSTSARASDQSDWKFRSTDPLIMITPKKP